MNKIVALALGTCAFGALVLALLVTTYTGESSATAKQNFCNSLGDFSGAVMRYDGLDPATATIDEFDSAAADVTNSWNDVVEEADDWSDADDNALAAAYDDLYWAIQTMPGDYTVAQSIESLEPGLSAFPGAFRTAFDGSGCTTSA